MAKRVFLIVLDSLGIGALPDAADYGDVAANTLGSIRKSPLFYAPNLTAMGLFNIDGIVGGVKTPTAAYARLAEKSRGKDTIIGHWEICGVVSSRPLPTYPNGFPSEIIEAFEQAIGRKTLCNKPYSGTEVIKDYGEEHIRTGKLIVYTSADSVFQIAAHEDVVPVAELYRYCETARDILSGEHGVGRVIARPFIGELGAFKRTANRHDYALAPPEKTVLDVLTENGKQVLAVGKIVDIFAGRGISEYVKTKSNADGMEKTALYAERDFEGLCFTNLVDFDMVYGHRRDVDGYARAVTEFDEFLGGFVKNMREDDVLVITADHGCDPAYSHTDHTREYVPLIAFGKEIKSKNLGTLDSFSDVGATVCELLGVECDTEGKSFASLV